MHHVVRNDLIVGSGAVPRGKAAIVIYCSMGWGNDGKVASEWTPLRSTMIGFDTYDHTQQVRNSNKMESGTSPGEAVLTNNNDSPLPMGDYLDATCPSVTPSGFIKRQANLKGLQVNSYSTVIVHHLVTHACNCRILSRLRSDDDDVHPGYAR